ncbi:hypothetical protein [Aliivibrio salmonicida]
MKTNIFIGLVAFSTSITAFANNAIVFPDSENNTRTAPHYFLCYR